MGRERGAIETNLERSKRWREAAALPHCPWGSGSGKQLTFCQMADNDCWKTIWYVLQIHVRTCLVNCSFIFSIMTINMKLRVLIFKLKLKNRVITLSSCS